jgi:hypothetical protein
MITRFDQPERENRIVILYIHKVHLLVQNCVNLVVLRVLRVSNFAFRKDLHVNVFYLTIICWIHSFDLKMNL